MALLHHYLIRLAAYQVMGALRFRDYIVLGDDVVIFNELVAGRYFSIITSIGVSISLPKTIRPSTDNLRGVEFASKLIVNGVNISPIPLGMLFQHDSIRLSNLFVYVFEASYQLGGHELIERLLRCIPS